MVTDPTPARRIASPDMLRRFAATFGPALAILAVQQVFFAVPLGIFVRGLIIGALGALVALGHGPHLPGQPHPQLRPGRPRHPARRARPHADVGHRRLGLELLPGGAASASSRRSLLGAIVELAVIRRFFTRAPADPDRGHPRPRPAAGRRGASCCPARLGEPAPRRPPGSSRRSASEITISAIVFDANSIIAMVVAPIAFVALAALPAAHQRRASPSGPAPTAPTGPRCSACR